MDSKRFDKNLAAGQNGEATIAQYLQSKGLAVLPVYEVEKDSFAGPRLFTPKSG